MGEDAPARVSPHSFWSLINGHLNISVLDIYGIIYNLNLDLKVQQGLVNYIRNFFGFEFQYASI